MKEETDSYVKFSKWPRGSPAHLLRWDVGRIAGRAVDQAAVAGHPTRIGYHLDGEAAVVDVREPELREDRAVLYEAVRRERERDRRSDLQLRHERCHGHGGGRTGELHEREVEAERIRLLQLQHLLHP